MLKSVLAGVTALAIAGGSLVYAQQSGTNADANQRWRPTAADMNAFGDARIAALKEGLKLTPEQAKNWPALEKALRDAAKVRSERFAARASADRPRDPIERLRTRAETMSQRGASLKTIADAAAPLYASLDEGQKHRFMRLAQLGGGKHHRGQWMRHHGRGGMHGDHHRGPRGGENAPRPQ